MISKFYLVIDKKDPIDSYIVEEIPESGDYVEVDPKVAECYNSLKEAHSGVVKTLFTLNKEVKKSVGPLCHQAYEEGRSNGENPYPELVED